MADYPHQGLIELQQFMRTEGGKVLRQVLASRAEILTKQVFSPLSSELDITYREQAIGGVNALNRVASEIEQLSKQPKQNNDETT